MVEYAPASQMPECKINGVFREAISYRIRRFPTPHDWVTDVIVTEHYLKVYGWVNNGSLVEFNGLTWKSDLQEYESRSNICEILLTPK